MKRKERQTERETEKTHGTKTAKTEKTNQVSEWKIRKVVLGVFRGTATVFFSSNSDGIIGRIEVRFSNEFAFRVPTSSAKAGFAGI